MLYMLGITSENFIYKTVWRDMVVFDNTTVCMRSNVQK